MVAFSHHRHLRALDAADPVLVTDLTTAPSRPIVQGMGSGMYLRLDARDRTIGLLGLEHPTIGHFAAASTRTLAGLGEVLALTVDNGGLALVRAARAQALFGGRGFVTPDDIKQVALPALRHRVRPAPEQEIEGRDADALLTAMLEQVPAPRK
jgi:MoxR-like ATPase